MLPRLQHRKDAQQLRGIRPFSPFLSLTSSACTRHKPVTGNLNSQECLLLLFLTWSFLLASCVCIGSLGSEPVSSSAVMCARRILGVEFLDSSSSSALREDAPPQSAETSRDLAVRPLPWRGPASGLPPACDQALGAISAPVQRFAAAGACVLLGLEGRTSPRSAASGTRGGSTRTLTRRNGHNHMCSQASCV